MQLQAQVEGNAGAEMFGRFAEDLRRAVERGLDRATELLERAVAAGAQSPLGAASRAPLGELARSVTREVHHESAVSVGRVFLGAPADAYGLFVETGTRPHFPPPAAIEGWVRRRLGITDDRQAREVAFLIGRKIARSGTPGRFLFERALAANLDRVVEILEEEVVKGVSGE